MATSETPNTIRGGASLILGTGLIGLGVLLLLGEFVEIDLGHYLWPFFIIVPGLLFFAGMLAGGKSASGLAIPGSVITTTGLLLFYQNTTGHWESWSYAWALFPTAVGVGMIIQGLWGDQPKIAREGTRLARVGITLFIVFGVFFELVLNVSGFWTAGQWLWPILLIAAGVFLIARRTFGRFIS